MVYSQVSSQATRDARRQLSGEPTGAEPPDLDARRQQAVLTADDERPTSLAVTTRGQLLHLVDVQSRLKETIRASTLRADSAHALVDYAVAHPSFTVRQVQRDLGLSYGSANGLAAQLVDLRVLAETGETYRRRFFSPAVLDVLLSA